MSETPTPASFNADPIEVVTPVGKHKVMIRPFVTGRSRVAIRKAMLSNIDITSNQQSKGDNFQTNAAAVMMEPTEVSMREMIISVDGDTSEPYEKVLDMHEDDYNVVQEAVDKITDLTNLSEKLKKA